MQPTGEPAGRRLAADLRSRILSGDLAEGAQLPSSAVLQAEHGVSASVVRDAINALKAEGLVVGQQGKGVFVIGGRVLPAGEDLPARVAALEAQLAALAKEIRTRPENMPTSQRRPLPSGDDATT